jgi:hypothetical protein
MQTSSNQAPQSSAAAVSTRARGSRFVLAGFMLAMLYGGGVEAQEPALGDLSHSADVSELPAAQADAFRAHLAAPIPETGINQIFDALKKRDPDGLYLGIYYGLSQTNSLTGDWVDQSPDWWGKPGAKLPVIDKCSGSKCNRDFDLPICNSQQDCSVGTCAPLAATVKKPGDPTQKLCLGHSDALVDRFYAPIITGKTLVDIATLEIPDGRFMAAIRNALTYLAHNGSTAHVRLLIGEPAACTLVKKIPAKVINKVLQDAFQVDGAQLTVTAACAQFGTFAWNHSKIVAVDGKRAVVGGHNMWNNQYLLTAPVNDLSMSLQGPATQVAHAFAGRLWTVECAGEGGSSIRRETYDMKTKTWLSRCATFPKIPAPPGSGNVTVLSVGDYSLRRFGNWARIAAFSMATSSIKMSQQDLGIIYPGGSAIHWPKETIEELAKAVLRNVDVYMVLSNWDAKAGDGTSYEFGITLMEVASKLLDAVRAQPGAPSGEALADLMCQHLHLAPLRFSTDATWPKGIGIANHAKFWMVDDLTFHIGSGNIYPADLAEFGFIVNGETPAAAIQSSYWDPEWQYSSKAAVSGANIDENRCIFRCNSLQTAPGFNFGWGNQPKVFADVNGDGAADYCRAIGSDSVLSCDLGGKDGLTGGPPFETKSGFDFGWGNQPKVFADVNGDGAADYCRAIGSDSVLSCALGSSTGFTEGTFKTKSGFDFGGGEQPEVVDEVKGEGAAD